MAIAKTKRGSKFISFTLAVIFGFIGGIMIWVGEASSLGMNSPRRQSVPKPLPLNWLHIAFMASFALYAVFCTLFFCAFILQLAVYEL